MKKYGFTLVEVLVVVVIVGILLSIAIPTIFSYVQKSKDTQDIVNIDAAKKMAMTHHLNKTGKHRGNSVYYFDAYKSKILDASDTADISKISEIKVYGISPSEHSSSERLGVTGIPKNHILEVSIDDKENFISICWVDLATAVAKGNALKSEISVENNENKGNSNSGAEDNSNGGGASGSTTGGASGSTTGGTSGSTTDGTSGSTTDGTSGSTNGGTSGSTTDGTSGNTNGGTSGSTTGGTSGSTNGGTSGSTNGGTSGSTNGGTSGNTTGGVSGDAAKPDSVGEATDSKQEEDSQKDKSPFAESWTEPETVNGVESLAKAILSGRSSSVPRDADISFCDKYGIDGYVLNMGANRTAAADYAAQKNGSADAYTKIITQVNIAGTNSTNAKLEPGIYKATQYLVSGTQKNVNEIRMHVSGVREIYVNVAKGSTSYFWSESDAQSKTNGFWPPSNVNWN